MQCRYFLQNWYRFFYIVTKITIKIWYLRAANIKSCILWFCSTHHSECIYYSHYVSTFYNIDCWHLRNTSPTQNLLNWNEHQTKQVNATKQNKKKEGHSLNIYDFVNYMLYPNDSISKKKNKTNSFIKLCFDAGVLDNKMLKQNLNRSHIRAHIYYKTTNISEKYYPNNKIVQQSDKCSPKAKDYIEVYIIVECTDLQTTTSQNSVFSVPKT